MTFEAELRVRGMRVITDSRAKHRGGFTPVGLEVVHLGAPDVATALNDAVATNDCPLVLITATGVVFVLAHSGTGKVAMQEAEGAVSPAASDALQQVLEVLGVALGIEAAPKPKPKKRKQSAVIETETSEGMSWLVVDADDEQVAAVEQENAGG